MSDAAPSQNGPARKLPLRDWVLLPLIAFCTVLFMSAGAEVTARVVWPEHLTLSCMVNDPVYGRMGRPNCANHVKAAEGPWVDTRYNECGLRATGPCHGFDPRYTRLVVLGSSTSWGYMVPFDETWSTRLARDLSARCHGAPVDVQSFPGFADINANARRIGPALALQPDMVMVVITPLDMEGIGARGFVAPVAGTAPIAKAQPGSEGVIAQLRDAVGASRAAQMAQHFLYRNPNVYIPAFLTNGDKADFMRRPFSPAWRHRVEAVRAAIHYYSARLSAQHVPLMIIYAPQQAQAQLIGEPQLHYPNIDPEELPNALEAIARENGALFADASDEFRHVRDVEDMYYNADGHLNGDGHALIADAVGRALYHTYGGAPLCSTPSQQAAR